MNNTSGVKALQPGQMTVKELCNAGLSNDKIVLSVSRLEELKENLDVALANKIRPCFTVDGLWGQIKSDVSRPELWSRAEKKYAQEFEESICRIMAVHC